MIDFLVGLAYLAGIVLCLGVCYVSLVLWWAAGGEDRGDWG